MFEGQINTFKADTLEELADKLEIADKAAFVASVKRYNELGGSRQGRGLRQAGELPWFPWTPPPFYGIHRHVRMSAICSGVDVNAKLSAFTPEGEVIENL